MSGRIEFEGSDVDATAMVVAMAQLAGKDNANGLIERAFYKVRCDDLAVAVDVMTQHGEDDQAKIDSLRNRIADLEGQIHLLIENAEPAESTPLDLGGEGFAAVPSHTFAAVPFSDVKTTWHYDENPGQDRTWQVESVEVPRASVLAVVDAARALAEDRIEGTSTSGARTFNALEAAIEALDDEMGGHQGPGDPPDAFDLAPGDL